MRSCCGSTPGIRFYCKPVTIVRCREIRGENRFSGRVLGKWLCEMTSAFIIKELRGARALRLFCGRSSFPPPGFDRSAAEVEACPGVASRAPRGIGAGLLLNALRTSGSPAFVHEDVLRQRVLSQSALENSLRQALIILAMVGRLIVMVMFSGYEYFAAAFTSPRKTRRARRFTHSEFPRVPRASVRPNPASPTPKRPKRKA